MYYCDLRAATKDYIKEKGLEQAVIDFEAMISGIVRELQEEKIKGELKISEPEINPIPGLKEN
jgi:hypothetical protein